MDTTSLKQSLLIYGTRFCYALKDNFLHFLQLQLFLTLFSLPILIAWGLPTSIMACVGNLFFAPFLTVFLFLSCLIFFCELLFVPNSFLITLLEYLTQLWSYCISFGSSSWLISFSKPSYLMLFMIVMSAFIVIHHKKTTTIIRAIICFLLVLALVYGVLHWWPNKQYCIETIAYNNNHITVIKTPNSLTVIDPGILAQKKSDKWIEFILVKYLVQNLGTTTIDNLIILKPTLLTLHAVADLCRLATVKTVYLAGWHGENPPQLLKAYGRMRYQLNENKGTLVRLNHLPKTIILDKQKKLILKPLKKMLEYKTISFPAFIISLMNGNDQELTLHSLGYDLENE